MHRCPGFLARRTLVTLKKIERLRIISIIFICGFPGPNANNSQAPQFANVEEAPAHGMIVLNISSLRVKVLYRSSFRGIELPCCVEGKSA